MSIIDTLITDRTQADIDRWAYLAALDYDTQMTDEEQTEWDSELKGAYNASDMNRVGEAVQYIADILATYGYTVNVTAKQDFAEPQDGDAVVHPTSAEAAAYIADIEAIRAAVNYAATTPQSIDNLTFETANEIERILKECGLIVPNIPYAYKHTGAAFSICGIPQTGVIS